MILSGKIFRKKSEGTLHRYSPCIYYGIFINYNKQSSEIISSKIDSFEM